MPQSDSRHPLHIIVPSQGPLSVAELFEQADDNTNQAGYAHSMITSRDSPKCLVRVSSWPLIRHLL
jgi:hypothetical protein